MAAGAVCVCGVWLSYLSNYPEYPAGSVEAACARKSRNDSRLHSIPQQPIISFCQSPQVDLSVFFSLFCLFFHSQCELFTVVCVLVCTEYCEISQSRDCIGFIHTAMTANTHLHNFY